ncbi:MAG: hypothetical protein ACYCX7_09285, partial [Solirubrobacteraceae bacterium]
CRAVLTCREHRCGQDFLLVCVDRLGSPSAAAATRQRERFAAALSERARFAAALSERERFAGA